MSLEQDVMVLEQQMVNTRHALLRAVDRIDALEREVRELRALATPLDRGAMPQGGEGP